MRICPHCETPTLAEICPFDGYQTVEAALYMDPDQDPFVGTVFHNRYRIESRLDIGGMSTVYRATQLAVGRPVALKIMNRELARDLKAVARFQHEARAVAGLRHPNTIRLFDYGQSEDGHLFLVMEFLDGEPLGKAIDREGPFEIDRAVHIAKQLLDALAEAHANGIVHRDLKPDNVFLTSVGLQTDFVKILDFGIAKNTRINEGRRSLTGTGLVMGSPGYMAPEQVQAQPSTEQTDIYAVGALLYEMITGHPIFEGESAIELAVKHVQDEVPPLIVNGEQLEGPLIDFILRCLAKRPTDRPLGAAAALKELLQVENAPVRTAWSGPAAPRHTRPTVEAPLPSQPSGMRAPTGQGFDVGLRQDRPSTISSLTPPPMAMERSPHRMWIPVLLIALAGLAVGGVYLFREYSRSRVEDAPKLETAGREVSTNGAAADAGASSEGDGGAVGAGVADASAATETAAAEGDVAASPGPDVAAAGADAGKANSDAGPGDADAAADVDAEVDGDAGEVDGDGIAGPKQWVEIKTIPGNAKLYLNWSRRGGEWELVGRTPMKVEWPADRDPPRVKIRHYHHETHRMFIREWQFGKQIRIEMEYDDTW